MIDKLKFKKEKLIFFEKKENNASPPVRFIGWMIRYDHLSVDCPQHRASQQPRMQAEDCAEPYCLDSELVAEDLGEPERSNPWPADIRWSDCRKIRADWAEELHSQTFEVSVKTCFCSIVSVVLDQKKSIFSIYSLTTLS